MSNTHIFPLSKFSFTGFLNIHCYTRLIWSSSQIISLSPLTSIKSRFRISGCYSSTLLTIVSSSKLSTWTSKYSKYKSLTFLWHITKSFFMQSASQSFTLKIHYLLQFFTIENLLFLDQLSTLYSYDLT